MQSSRILTFVSGLLLAATLASAADLAGRVTARGAPLPGALVTANLLGPRGPAAVSVVRTDSGGVYVFRALRAGEYILLVDINGRRIYQGRITLTNSALVKNIALQ
jgi:hypothetical protein